MNNGTVAGKSNIIACVWDFDKTLIPSYMEETIFFEYGIDGDIFWNEVNAMKNYYSKQNIAINEESTCLNHLLTYVKCGKLKGLTNKKLREFGAHLKFFPGLPEFFRKLKNFVREDTHFAQYNITLEHYIISSGLCEIIKGSEIASYVDGIFASEFIEKPLTPGFLSKTPEEIAKEAKTVDSEISQIARIIDNTQKTRCIFEISKGCNKDPKISVNSVIRGNNKRIPIKNMIYIADGPSDVPAFAVVRNDNGLAYAVYDEKSDLQFEQSNNMLSDQRIDSYGPANYTDQSSTVRWLKMQIKNICHRIITEADYELKIQTGKPPVHIHE